MLLCIEDHPARYTTLIVTAIRDSTPWVAQSVIKWLLKERYIERPERGIYKITEKGRRLLRALVA
ncbi:winged helix-turn-helix domain-containing protein [Candidatus Bathyarchaeota archaeon]|nr:winged helix-turn-helix domain-containing protein [Candidatus Bathyarchaeota archaeon]